MQKKIMLTGKKLRYTVQTSRLLIETHSQYDSKNGRVLCSVTGALKMQDMQRQSRKLAQKRQTSESK